MRVRTGPPNTSLLDLTRWVVADKELTAFAHALRGATTTDVGAGMHMLSLSPATPFPYDDRGRSDLLVLDFYPALLSGVAGTGKSWWVWYALHVLLNQDPAPAVVLQSFKAGGGSCMLFKDGQAYLGSLDTFRQELDQASTWYFADGVLPRWSKARTVMLHYPKHEATKEWTKGRSIRLIMPLWTWPEMEKLWEQLYQSKLPKGCRPVPLERARRNFELWYGGVPRHVLERPSTARDEARDKGGAHGAVCTASAEQVLVAIEGQYDAVPDAAQLVVHQDGSRETFAECSRRFATHAVGELFAAVAASRGTPTVLMLQLACPSVTTASPGSREHFFEAMMPAVLSSSCGLEYKFLDVPCSAPPAGGRARGRGRPSSKPSPVLQAALHQATVEAATAAGTAPGEPLHITLPEMQQRVFASGAADGSVAGFTSAAQQCTYPCYLQPACTAGAHRPAIDACLFPDTLVRFETSAGAGGLDEQALELHLQGLPDRQRYYLDYVLPADAYAAFKPGVVLERDAAARPRLARTYVRAVKVTVAP